MPGSRTRLQDLRALLDAWDASRDRLRWDRESRVWRGWEAPKGDDAPREPDAPASDGVERPE